MKTRNGFVSNSSTSSFILVGFEVPEGTSLEDLPVDMCFLTPECSNYPEVIVGQYLINVENQVCSVCFDALNLAKREVEEFRDRSGITSEVRIYGGQETDT